MFLKHETAAQAIDEEVDRHIESCSQEQLKGSKEEVSEQVQENLKLGKIKYFYSCKYNK